MLLGGKRPKHNVKVIVFPREGEESIVFKAGAVTDMALFDTLCPDPKPPTKTLPGGVKVPDFEDPNYIIMISQRGDRRWDFITLQSLKATENLQWETVDLNNPDTWANWRKEATDSGLSHFETNQIVNIVIQANSLSESMLEEARRSFLAGQVQA